MTRASIIILCAALSACSSGGANHIGNPLTLPGRAIINGVQNASYNARRAKVSDYVNANLPAIYRDIDARGGPNISAVMDLARVDNERRAALINELAGNPDIYRQPDTEPLIVAIMVHGD